MNRDKRVTVRFTKNEYETLERKCKEYGVKQLSLYIRKKMLVDRDEYLFNVNRIRDIYNRLAQLEMEFETIKNEAGLSEYETLNYEIELENLAEQIKMIK